MKDNIIHAISAVTILGLSVFSFIACRSAIQNRDENNAHGLWLNYSSQVHVEDLIKSKKIVIWIDQGTEVEKQIGDYVVVLKKLQMNECLKNEFSQHNIESLAIAHQNGSVLQYLAHVHAKNHPKEAQEIVDLWDKNTVGKQKMYLNFDLKNLENSGVVNIYKPYKK